MHWCDKCDMLVPGDGDFCCTCKDFNIKILGLHQCFITLRGKNIEDVIKRYLNGLFYNGKSHNFIKPVFLYNEIVKIQVLQDNGYIKEYQAIGELNLNTKVFCRKDK